MLSLPQPEMAGSAYLRGHRDVQAVDLPPAPPSSFGGRSVGTASIFEQSREETATLLGVDPRQVLLCDLGSKALLVEDMENALRLWSRPVVLIANRNALDRLPSNVPGTILFLDLSWNR